MHGTRAGIIVGVGVVVAGVLATVAAAGARPNRYGHSDREERHLFPAVSSGPLEPAWRPDGRRIALSMDVAGNLEIGIVDAAGGPVQRIASHPRVDLEPTWARDGNSLFFSSARNSGWRIFRHDFSSGTDTALTTGIQPSVSPDGRFLAYAQSGLRVLDLTTLESRLVRAEENEYRMKPVWTADGRHILYATEDLGSNDIRASVGPIGADRLYNLARLGYYDDTRIHRVNANYIAQFGLHGDPAVNAAWKDQYLKDDPPRSTNTRGTVAFAMKGREFPLLDRTRRVTVSPAPPTGAPDS